MNLRKAKYRTGILTAGAVGIIIAASAMAEKEAPDFSELDKNDDGRLVSAELDPLASHHQRQSESILNSFDQNNDQALSQQEYSQAVDELSSQQQAGRTDSEEENEGDRIVVEEQPAQVTVDRPPAQITVEQSEPQVTVEQGQPEVSVEKSEPEVSVEQAEPEVTVKESEPGVDVQSEEPEVVIQDRQNQNQASQPQQEQGEQETLSQRGQAGWSQDSGDVYSLSISDIQESRVHDSQGNSIGGVEDVIVKNDGTDAGVVVRSQSEDGSGQLYYIPANAISVENDQLVLDQQKFAEEAENADQFNPQDYNVITGSDRSLNEYINPEEVTQR